MREIGERLQARARELGLTDAEVARRLDLAQGRYSNYVNGNREPDLALFARICRELSVTPDEILGFAPGRDVRNQTRLRLDALLDSLEPDRLALALTLISALSTHPRTATVTAARRQPKARDPADGMPSKTVRRKAREA